MNGDERKSLLLTAGIKLAAKMGAENVSRRDIAKAAKVSEPLVSRYLGSKSEIPKAIAKAAKKAGVALPDKAQSKLLGEKLRKATRQAAAKKTMAKRAVVPKAAKAKKYAVAKKTAARKPKAIPQIVIPSGLI